MSVKQWQAGEEKYLARLRHMLMDDGYRSKLVKGVKILKRGSKKKKRQLGIPVIRDRVCQQAVLNVLQQIVEFVQTLGEQIGKIFKLVRALVLAGLEQYEQVTEALRTIETRFGYEIDPDQLALQPMYAEYARSEAYQQWKGSAAAPARVE